MTRLATSTTARAVCGGAVVVLLLAVAAGRAVAEGNQTPPGAAPPVQIAPQQLPPPAPSPASAPVPVPPAVALIPPQPPPPAQPGFLHQLKGWWDDSIRFFNARIKDTRGTVDNLNKTSRKAVTGAADVAKGAANTTRDVMKNAVEVTKDAASTIARLPNTRAVQVREPCAKAPNGASDCETAASKACRAKGFGGGKPLDVRTAANCDAVVAQTGQIPSPDECPIETVVIRALCQ